MRRMIRLRVKSLAFALSGIALFGLLAWSAASPKKPVHHWVAKKKPAAVKLSPALIKEGAKLFKTERCINCHMMGKTGGKFGPNLTHYGKDKNANIAWITVQIKNPAAHSKKNRMMAYPKLKPIQYKALAEYLMSHK